jgi:predicted glycosyltransferase
MTERRARRVSVSFGARKRPRILIYIQDSGGLGHIQRVSKLARVLQNSADCMILCGHREAGWIVPDTCEYIRIPGFNTPLTTGDFWSRRSCLRLSQDEGTEVRRKLITGAISAFAPDAILVENRPLGMNNELYGILESTKAVKFFLTRGIMTHPSRVRELYLNPEVEGALRTMFHKVIVGADRRVWDLASNYNLDRQIADKLEYVGYMNTEVHA